MSKKEKKRLEAMKIPEVNIDRHKRIYGMVLLNTRKTAFIGLLLLVLPFFFITGVLFKYYLNIQTPLLTGVYEWIAEFDKKQGDNSILNWIIRILLLFGPTIAVLVNLLSIVHVRFEKNPSEMHISIKMKWLNWSIITFCLLILFVFLSYLILENI